MTIAMMKAGDEFVVSGVRLGRELGRRLADMGFIEGARGALVRKGLLGGPMQIRMGDCDIMIRASEAAGVEVRPVEGGFSHNGGRRSLRGASE